MEGSLLALLLSTIPAFVQKVLKNKENSFRVVVDQTKIGKFKEQIFPAIRQQLYLPLFGVEKSRKT